MTTVAKKKTDEATLMTQLKQVSHNAQVKLDKIDAQKADIERKRVELGSELASISPARERYHQRLQVAQNEVSQLKVQLVRLAQYLELARGTLEEQAAIDDVARVQKQVDDAEQALARIQKETEDADQAFTSREQEIHNEIQALDTRYQEISAEHSSITAIRQQKHDELCEVLFTLLTGPYLKNRERLEALQRELVSIQAECRAECAKLAGWTQLRQRLHETILPDSPSYRVLSAELAYLEALVAEQEHLREPVNLPASRMMVAGPKTKAELLSLPYEEIALAMNTVIRRTDKIEVRIALLKQIIGELDRF